MKAPSILSRPPYPTPSRSPPASALPACPLAQIAFQQTLRKQIMSTPAFIVATVKLRPGIDSQFTAWKAHHDLVIGKFPGFVGSDIIPPTKPNSNEWTIILNFRSNEDLVVWQKSKERAKIIAEGLELFEGGNFGEVVQAGESGERPDSNVTEVIFSKIKPDKEDTYREWAARIQSAQAKYPGYQGTFLQPPDEKGGFWTTIMRFDSASHLEAWMNAPERKEMLNESKAFIEYSSSRASPRRFPDGSRQIQQRVEAHRIGKLLCSCFWAFFLL